MQHMLFKEGKLFTSLCSLCCHNPGPPSLLSIALCACSSDNRAPPGMLLKRIAAIPFSGARLLELWERTMLRLGTGML